jgi:hypothetical protein
MTTERQRGTTSPTNEGEKKKFDWGTGQRSLRAMKERIESVRVGKKRSVTSQLSHVGCISGGIGVVCPHLEQKKKIGGVRKRRARQDVVYESPVSARVVGLPRVACHVGAPALAFVLHLVSNGQSSSPLPAKTPDGIVT